MIIKQRYFDCGEGTAQSIKKCGFDSCSLYSYRNGKNPARKGVGGNYALNQYSSPKKGV